MTDKRTVQVDITRDEAGYSAFVQNVPAAFTAAQDLDTLLEALTEVISWSLEYDDEQADIQAGKTPPPPDPDITPRPKYLTRLVRLELEIERDLRPDHSDTITQQAPRAREPHRENWPPRWHRTEGGPH